MSTLRGRLFALVAVTVLAATVGTVAVSAVLVNHRLAGQRKTLLARQAEALATTAPDGPHVYAAGRRGGALRELRGARAQRVLALVPARTSATGALQLARREQLYATEPTSRGRVVVLRPAALAGQGFGPYLRGILLAGLAGALGAGLIALVLAGRVARPLRDLAAATRRVAAGERTEVDAGPGAAREVHDLAEAFTDMAGGLADARDAQRTFLLSVSHELKTPLTAIRGYAEAAQEDAVDPREAMRVVGAESERLERLVDDLLQLARADRHGFEARRESVDLAAVVRHTVERHAPRAGALGVRLEATPVGSARGLGDADRLSQALSNLVENALRVTPQGGTITIAARDGELSVTDTGPGLAPEDLPRAFERFYLHDRHRSDRIVGSGLGLALVSELLAAMGGRAAVQNAPGAGTVFTLTVSPSPD